MSVPVIVVGTLILGALNSLMTKYQDKQCIKNCDNPDMSTHQVFEQPVVQTLQMFVGEMAIFLIYYLYYKSSFAKKLQGESIAESRDAKLPINQSLKLAFPAIFDLLATTLMNVGLLFIPVSVYQMTRGAVVIFVALLSVLLLKVHLKKLEWISLMFVTVGIAVVGVSGTNGSPSESNESETRKILGIVLVLGAVCLQALQFVSEELILREMSVIPLKVVYFEGFYGSLILSISMVFFHFIFKTVESPRSFEDSPFNLSESFSQLFHSKQIIISSVLIMISISSFNFFGVSITHRLSATARTTIDTCRTLVVWLFALVIGWEKYSILQTLGFIMLVFGTLCFNGALSPEEWSFVPDILKEKPSVASRSLPEEESPLNGFGTE